MAGFVAGLDRGQATLLPECLEDWVDESNPIRVIDALVDALDLRKLGFEGVDAAEIGRPAYHPSVHLISSSTSMVTSIACSRAVG
jgi:transposase